MSKRAYIPWPERCAALASLLLPSEVRNHLRIEKAPAEKVNRMFEFHHIVFHAHGGPNTWDNLIAMRKEDHRERTAKIDVPAIAKVKRLSKKQEEFRARMLKPAAERKAEKRSRWGKRPMRRR